MALRESQRLMALRKSACHSARRGGGEDTQVESGTDDSEEDWRHGDHRVLEKPGLHPLVLVTSDQSSSGDRRCIVVNVYIPVTLVKMKESLEERERERSLSTPTKANC